MPNSKLVLNDGKEIALGDGIISLGRVSGNSISFPDDSNVSRYHAEIEPRDGDFWLIELGSSNGTTVNGEPVTSEVLLKDGDEILLGGTSEVRFEVEKEKSAETKPETGAESSAEEDKIKANSDDEAEVAEDTTKASKMPMMLGVMGVLCGLAVICVAAAVIYSWNSDTKCAATVKITSPDDQEVISKETEIKTKVEGNTACVQQVVFVIENQEVAKADTEPYKASINPNQFGSLSDGQTHTLTAVLEDDKGNKIPQTGSIGLIFETIAEATPTPEETPDATPTPAKKSSNKAPNFHDIQQMVTALLKPFSKPYSYKLSNQEFILSVQKKTAEYATAEGYFERAKGKDYATSDTINVAFVREKNLDAPLGFYLAMSRSKFNPQKQGANEGMWQMSNDFATANSLNGTCGTETLSDPAQTCAARVVALYMKSIFIDTFDRDPVYSVAAFGMTPNEAAIWKATLPPDRSDFWNVIPAKQRDEVVRFFAAGIVAENPQKFGLKKDRPLSELYTIAMAN